VICKEEIGKVGGKGGGEKIDIRKRKKGKRVGKSLE
jgi:hypothetical protein